MAKNKKWEFSKVGSILEDIAKKSKLPILFEKDETDLELISTGIYILNAALCGDIFGGVTAGQITAFAGPEASGKSFLTLNTSRMAIEQGYGVIYIDTENALRYSDLPSYGIDKEKMQIMKSNKIEEINMELSQTLDQFKKAKDDGIELPKILIVIDSLAQLASQKEKEDLIKGNLKQDMTKAKAIGSLFRSITMDLAYLNIPLIVNNQTYQTMDLFPQEVMKGGKSLYYSASNIVFLSKAKLKTGDEDDQDFQSGIIVTAKNFKNRKVKPKKVKFEISFEEGCNPFKGLEIFCTPRFFDQIGIAKGKYIKYDKPVEVVDEVTGETYLKEGEIEEKGNRWYIKHLDKSVFTKQLHTPEIFNEDVLNAIRPIAKAYFKYKSVDDIESETNIDKQSENALKDDEVKDASDIDSADFDDLTT